MSHSTLCWTCTRPGTGTCAWDDSCGETPVEGWTAQAALLEGCIKSYRVILCPEYIPCGREDAESKPVPKAREVIGGTKERKERMDILIRSGARTEFISQTMNVSISTVKRRRRELYG